METKDIYEKCNICKENLFDFCVRECENCSAYECNACGNQIDCNEYCTCCD